MRDAEVACRALLIDSADVLAAAPGGVTTSLAADQTFPCIRLSSLGGPGRDSVSQARDRVTVRVEAWGEHDDRAGLAALREAARNAVMDGTGTTTNGGHVAATRELSGPTWAPDATDNRPRFTWTVELTLT